MYEKVVFGNKLRLICENIPHVRSVAVGVWVANGSRNEIEENNGISHFIEHMLFKGTENRTGKQISEVIDGVGGQLNAFTGKECTCFYSKTLDADIELSFSVLSDMLLNSLIQEKDVDIERKVILEELGMYEDAPDDVAYEYLYKAAWGNDALGRAILGTRESLARINSTMIKEYMKKTYIPENCVISVAGNFDKNELISLVEKYFGSWKSDKDSILSTYNIPEFKSNLLTVEKDTEQVHLCYGFESIGTGEDLLYSVVALNNLFGDGISSRLFQKGREELGIAYSIYSSPSSYKSTGIYMVYAGTGPKTLGVTSDMIVSEIEEIKNNGITKEEFDKALSQMRGNYMLGLENTIGRMSSMGKAELMTGKVLTQDDVLDKINSVTMDTINQVINRIFNFEKCSISVAGIFEKKDIEKMKKVIDIA